MLWEREGEESINIQIIRKKWRWIGHTLRKPTNSITGRCYAGILRARGRGATQGTPG